MDASILLSLRVVSHCHPSTGSGSPLILNLGISDPHHSERHRCGSVKVSNIFVKLMLVIT